MSHIHLFEFEDQQWFPQVVRQGMMDFLRFGISLTDFYEPVAPFINQTLKATNQNIIVELCAGGGGGVLKMSDYLDNLNCSPQIFLCDLYPNISTYEKLKHDTSGRIDYIREPVNALNVPASLKGMRVLFSSFHHFRPAAAKQILADAAKKKVPIGIFDAGAKSIFTILFGVILLQPIVFFLLTPFIKPFRWSRLLFTYLIPLIPLCTVWDGSISILRFYTVTDLNQLISEIKSDSYAWEVGQVKNRLGVKVNYVIGKPL